MLFLILIDDVDIDADVDAFFFSVARRKRRIITQRWRRNWWDWGGAGKEWGGRGQAHKTCKSKTGK